ncbi:hypothetical protein KY366_01100 [Candidatus Woesearchaeota archaeon]|nr:hypothetical protein [Candidatus Woesearchaeota archaeon]
MKKKALVLVHVNHLKEEKDKFSNLITLYDKCVEVTEEFSEGLFKDIEHVCARSGSIGYKDIKKHLSDYSKIAIAGVWGGECHLSSYTKVLRYYLEHKEHIDIELPLDGTFFYVKKDSVMFYNRAKFAGDHWMELPEDLKGWESHYISLDTLLGKEKGDDLNNRIGKYIPEYIHAFNFNYGNVLVRVHHNDEFIFRAYLAEQDLNLIRWFKRKRGINTDSYLKVNLNLVKRLG